MSSATADSYPESVSSCRPPTPPTPSPLPRPPATTPEPAPAVAHGGSARRQLDFADADAGAGAGGDLEDGDDFLSAVDVDDIVRGYEAKRQAPPCVCGRGACAVRRDEQSGRWMYVCSSQPVSLPNLSERPSFFPLILLLLDKRLFPRLLWVGKFVHEGGFTV